eukprot:15331220-Ditylum_brightwellii.AAC.1
MHVFKEPTCSCYVEKVKEAATETRYGDTDSSAFEVALKEIAEVGDKIDDEAFIMRIFQELIDELTPFLSTGTMSLKRR